MSQNDPSYLTIETSPPESEAHIESVDGVVHLSVFNDDQGPTPHCAQLTVDGARSLRDWLNWYLERGQHIDEGFEEEIREPFGPELTEKYALWVNPGTLFRVEAPRRQVRIEAFRSLSQGEMHFSETPICSVFGDGEVVGWKELSCFLPFVTDLQAVLVRVVELGKDL